MPPVYSITIYFLFYLKMIRIILRVINNKGEHTMDERKEELLNAIDTLAQIHK